MKTQPTKGNPTSIIAIYADDKIGLLGQVINLINRPYYQIISLNVARTDVREIILITLEVEIAGQALQSMLYKLERIIEVCKAIAWPANEVSLNLVGYYRVSLTMLDDELWHTLKKHGAVVTKVLQESLIIQKTGDRNNLRQLYNDLECCELISYCETPMPVEQSLLKLDTFF